MAIVFFWEVQCRTDYGQFRGILIVFREFEENVVVDYESTELVTLLNFSYIVWFFQESFFKHFWKPS